MMTCDLEFDMSICLEELLTPQHVKGPSQENNDIYNKVFTVLQQYLVQWSYKTFQFQWRYFDILNSIRRQLWLKIYTICKQSSQKEANPLVSCALIWWFIPLMDQLISFKYLHLLFHNNKGWQN